MILLRIGIFLGFFLIIPFLLGMLLCGNRDKIRAYIYGWMIMLALFEILVLPLIFLKASFQTFCILWMTVIIILALFGLYKNRKNLPLKFANTPHPTWTGIFFVLQCLVQVILVAVLQHSDADDMYFIGIANTSLSTNTMLQFEAYTGQPAASFPLRYVFSPFPIFIACISKFTGIHPAIIAHTLFPIVFIPIFYLIMYKLGEKIFTEKAKILLFCNIIALLNFFGNYSIYTSSTFLLFRIWQGKAIVANIILPVLFLGFLEDWRENENSFLTLLVVVLAGCGVSSMGIILQLLILFVYGLVYLIQKQWKKVLKVFLACIPCFALSLAYIIASGR